MPVYFLDTQLDSNSPWDRQITDCLYGGDQRHRLCQEAVLGFGGIAMLEALGHRNVEVLHMNEGHSALFCFRKTSCACDMTCNIWGRLSLILAPFSCSRIWRAIYGNRI